MLIKYLKNLFGQTLSLIPLNACEGFYAIILEMKKKKIMFPTFPTFLFVHVHIWVL